MNQTGVNQSQDELNAMLNYLIKLQKANLLAILALNPTLSEAAKLVCTKDALSLSGMFSDTNNMFLQDDNNKDRTSMDGELDTLKIL